MFKTSSRGQSSINGNLNPTFAGGPVAWFHPSVTQRNPAASRARAEFKFHCQMLEDLVIGAQELGNDLDVGRPRPLDTGQVHLPVNAPGGMLALNALVLPVFPGRAVDAALDESQAVASVRGDDIGARRSWRAVLVTSVGGARVGYATAGGGGKAGNSGGGVTRSDVGACRVLISDTWACCVADICLVFNAGMGVLPVGASASGRSVWA